MKLGVISGWQNEASLDTVKELGFAGMEFCVNVHDDEAAFLDASCDLFKALRERNLETFNIGRWGQPRVDEKGQIIKEAFDGDVRLIDAASNLKCPIYTLGVNANKNMSEQDNIAAAISYLQKIGEYAKQKGIKLALYNCNAENFILSPAQWEPILNALPEIGIKYDPSHCVARTKGYTEYLKEMRNWAHKFVHFHAKGALLIDGHPYDDPPCGMDRIEWGPVFDILYTKDYQGNVCYEPHSLYWTGAKGMWGIEFSKQYLDQFFIPEDYNRQASSAYSI